MIALLLVAAVLVAALVVLLVTPLQLDLALGAGSGARGTRFSWAGGVVAVEIGKGAGAGRRAPRRRRRPARPRSGARRLPPAGALLAATRPLVKFVRGLLRATHPRNLHARVRFGFADPADTGMLCAWLAPIPTLLGASEGAVVAAEPSFDEEVWDWSIEGRLRMIPIEVVWLALGFALAPAVLRLAWQTTRTR